jgi:hypothetical protein
MLEYLARKGAVQRQPIQDTNKAAVEQKPAASSLLYVQSSVTVAHPLSNWNGRLKRKLDVLPRDAKRLAIRSRSARHLKGSESLKVCQCILGYDLLGLS